MKIPEQVKHILAKLEEHNFEAFIVGGSVRDVLLSKDPKDWDTTTNATPEEIQKIFPKSFYTNNFGTVTVITTPNPSLPRRGTGNADKGVALPLSKGESEGVNNVEVTTYRTDGNYSDNRHPDSVNFTKNLEEDLARRDFTINAMALESAGAQVIDPFNGQEDIEKKLIRAVGNPAERFSEDALRLLRAVRFATQLDFRIEEETLAGIKKLAPSILDISQERIRDELEKIIMSNNPERGLNLLRDTGLLEHILPEIHEGIGIDQNKHHVFTVYDHNVKSLGFAAKYDYPFHIRIAALFHDCGKPKTRQFDKAQNDYTFYAHDIVGAKMTRNALKRLRFDKETVQEVSHLVRHHMFYYDVGKITDAGIRRMLKRVGPENFNDLIKLRIAERKGSGVPKAKPYRLRHLQFMAEKVSQQAISTSQLKIDGNDLMKELNIKPGPQIGGIMNALLAEVIDDPAKNNRDQLLTRAKELTKHDPATLKKLAKEIIDEEEKKREDDIKRKYHV